MNKLKARELAMVLGLIIGLAGYLFYSFIWVGLKEGESIALEERRSLETSLSTQNVPQVEEKLEILNSQIKDIDLKIAEVNAQRTFGAVEYQKLVTYMGQEADKLDIDLVNFNKMDTQDRTVYKEIPYEVTVQGEYDNLILFVNSLYEMDRHFFITATELLEVERMPMTSVTIEGDSNLREKIEFKWGNGFMDKLDESIPAELRLENQKAFMDDFSAAMNEYKDDVNFDVSNGDPLVYDKLQLRFVLQFVEVQQ